MVLEGLLYNPEVEESALQEHARQAAQAILQMSHEQEEAAHAAEAAIMVSFHKATVLGIHSETNNNILYSQQQQLEQQQGKL